MFIAKNRSVLWWYLPLCYSYCSKNPNSGDIMSPIHFVGILIFTNLIPSELLSKSQISSIINGNSEITWTWIRLLKWHILKFGYVDICQITTYVQLMTFNNLTLLTTCLSLQCKNSPWGSTTKARNGFWQRRGRVHWPLDLVTLLVSDVIAWCH